jgi:hypothetical protein
MDVHSKYMVYQVYSFFVNDRNDIYYIHTTTSTKPTPRDLTLNEVAGFFG